MNLLCKHCGWPITIGTDRVSPAPDGIGLVHRACTLADSPSLADIGDDELRDERIERRMRDHDRAGEME